MQSITRNGLADPGLIGVKEGPASWSSALVLFFPAVGLGLAAAGGDGRRHSGGPAGPDAGPRLFAAALYFNWHRRLPRSPAAAVGIFMTTADVRDVQTAMIWLAGSLQAATWPLLAVAFAGRCPGPSSCSVPPGRRTWRCWATGPPSASAYVCSS